MEANETAPDRSAILIAELDPPRGTNLKPLLETALAIRGRVQAVRVTDGEHAIMRMSPLAPCLTLKEKGLDAQMVINGRDRNRISFQADLLCAASLGIKEVIIKEGHDPKEGDQPLVRSSGDLDLEIMLKCAASLNRGKDLAGESIDGRTAFDIGVHIQLSDDIRLNRERAEYFIQLQELGVTSVTLSPTYDLNIIEQFQPFAQQTGIRLYGSLMLLKSVTMIKYLNKLPGVPSIPQEFLKKMMQATDKSNAGIRIGADFYRELAPVVDGVVLQSLGWNEKITDFLEPTGR